MANGRGARNPRKDGCVVAYEYNPKEKTFRIIGVNPVPVRGYSTRGSFVIPSMDELEAMVKFQKAMQELGFEQESEYR